MTVSPKRFLRTFWLLPLHLCYFPFEQCVSLSSSRTWLQADSRGGHACCVSVKTIDVPLPSHPSARWRSARTDACRSLMGPLSMAIWMGMSPKGDSFVVLSSRHIGACVFAVQRATTHCLQLSWPSWWWQPLLVDPHCG